MSTPFLYISTVSTYYIMLFYILIGYPTIWRPLSDYTTLVTLVRQAQLGDQSPLKNGGWAGLESRESRGPLVRSVGWPKG